jgi:hypothetical protein
VSIEEDFNELTQLKQVEYYENQSDKLLLKNRSEIVLFLLTKNYHKSKLFDKHWNEALQMKKPVLVL